MKKTLAIFLSSTMAISGCATASKDVASSYVSPLQYQTYDCGQLAAESQRIQTRVVELGGRLDQAASNDKAIAGVGIILFWPVLFALGGTKSQEAEFGRLKGETEAVQKTAIEKRCGVGTTAATPATSTATPVPAIIPALQPASASSKS
jgi:hypothetical protein